MRMKNKTRTWKDERGMSLVIVLISMVTLGLLATGVAFVAVADVGTTANYKELNQARYAAEAGVQRTVNWLTNNYNPPTTFTAYNTTGNAVRCVSGCTTTSEVMLSGISGVASNYPDSAVITAYQAALSGQAMSGLATASYSTSAKLVNMTPAASATWLGANGPPQTWQITSQGYVSGVRNATVQVVATYERTGTPVFTHAVFATGTACPTILLAGGAITDSYDSSAGTYAATAQASGGDVGTNGTLTFNGANSAVKGNAYLTNVVTIGSCPTQTFSNSSSIGITGNGGLPIARGAPQTLSAPSYTNPSPALTSSTSYTSDISLAPGNYNNVAVSGGSTLTLSPGTYNFNSLTMSGNSFITISPAGKVVLQIAGAGSPATALDLSGGTLTNGGGNPADFQIVYNGSRPITLSGGTNSAGVVYAPNSPVTISGGAPWFGSVVGSQFLNSGGSAVHYDRNLNASLLVTGTFHPVGFSWSKF